MGRYSLVSYRNIGKFIRELRRLTTYVNTTSSDPGASGVLTPMCHTDGLYFYDQDEPEGFKDSFDDIMSEYIKSNEDWIEIETDNLTKEDIMKLLGVIKNHETPMEVQMFDDSKVMVIKQQEE